MLKSTRGEIMKPMIAFDIDGTLMDNVHHQVCPSTLQALKQLKENGYPIIIATGRAVESLKRTGIDQIINWDGFVCNNGQIILDQDFNIIEEHIISPEIVEECIDVAKKHHIPLALKMEHRILTQEPDDNVLNAIRFFNSILPPVGTYHGQKVQAMIAYGPMGYDYEPFRHIKGLSILPGVSTYCDITHNQATKATGIKKLLEFYHCDEYICFGDSTNDLEMFKYAKISLCMGQGDPLAKEKATYVIDSIDQDGLYKGCIKIGLI